MALTKREALVITAFTGVMMVKSLEEFQEFAEDTLDRPVMTHEMADKSFWKKMAVEVAGEFLGICNQVGVDNGPKA